MTGTRVAYYEILEKLGAGGMGEVWKAEDTRLGRIVAIKFLKHDYTERFEREARAISALNHPNICTLYDVGEHGGEPYLVMEYIDGKPLRGPLPLDRLLDCAIQMASALEAAHAKGLIHRDIKPANVLLTCGGQVKVLDFGLARLVKPGEEDSTQTQYAGTPGYMSPEQAHGEGLDARTDIFSFGVLLHEMVTGARPVPGTHHALPTELERIIGKALETDRTVRYQSAAELGADLKRLQRDTESHPTVVTRPNRRGLWFAAAAVVLLVAALGLWLWRSRVSAPAARSKAVAVLYFRNLSQDRTLDWLDSGLCEMLTTNLSQVKGMDVLSIERVAAALERMGKKEMNAGVAPEVARSAGAAAFVTGALMRVGAEKLRLDVRVQDVAGQVLFSEKVEGGNIDAVFKMVDALTARMAERLLPAASLPGKAPALEEVATSNMEAFRHYQLGVDAFRRFEMRQVLKESEEAVRLDPQFALAWFQLWLTHVYLGESRKATDMLRKLSGMESRLPRKLQLHLHAAMALDGYDWNGSERAYEALLAEFPRETMARVGLAATRSVRDRFDLAAEALREGLRLDPNEHLLWSELSLAEAGTGNLTAALEANGRFRALLPGNPVPLLSRGVLFFVAGRDEEAIEESKRSFEMGPAAMDHVCRLVLAFIYADQRKYSLAESTLREYGRLSKDFRVRFFEAHLEEAQGRLDRARELYRKALSQQADRKRYDAAAKALLALAHISEVEKDSASALAFARQQQLGGEEYQPISFLEAVEGDLAGAERSLQRYASACPWVTPAGLQIFRTRNHLVAALQRNDRGAVPAAAPRLPMMPETWMPLYEARAALLRRDYGSAEHLLRRTLFFHRWLFATGGHDYTRSLLVGSLCHFYLGQVYEATSKREQAIAEYREFLSVFDGSASRLPQVADTRAALGRLGAP